MSSSLRRQASVVVNAPDFSGLMILPPEFTSGPDNFYRNGGIVSGNRSDIPGQYYGMPHLLVRGFAESYEELTRLVSRSLGPQKSLVSASLDLFDGNFDTSVYVSSR